MKNVQCCSKVIIWLAVIVAILGVVIGLTQPHNASSVIFKIGSGFVATVEGIAHLMIWILAVGALIKYLGCGNNSCDK